MFRSLYLSNVLISDVSVSLFYQILHRYKTAKGNTVFTLNTWTLQILTVLVLKFEQVHLHALLKLLDWWQYCRLVIESTARPTVMQLKRTTTFLTTTGMEYVA